MLRGFNSRSQLERLHDRHKRFSINVYGHSTKTTESTRLEAAKRKLKEIVEMHRRLRLKSKLTT